MSEHSRRLSKYVVYDPRFFKHDITGERVGAWIVAPECECSMPIGLQEKGCSAHTEYKSFTFDGNAESPTFSPSVLPYSDRCDRKHNVARCHFFIRAGMCHHTNDSKYPNAVIPLRRL